MKSIFLTIATTLIGSAAIADDLTVTVTNAAGSTPTGSIDLSVSGGVAPFTYNWSGPSGYTSTVEDPSGLEPGNYTITVTDAYCGVAVLNVFVDSTSTGLDENFISADFDIFPNPSIDFITVQFNYELLNARIDIVNELGEIVFSDKFENKSRQLDISNLTRGTYLVRIQNNGSIYRRKLIKS